jgi:hypothetical protein
VVHGPGKNGMNKNIFVGAVIRWLIKMTKELSKTQRQLKKNGINHPKISLKMLYNVLLCPELICSSMKI